MLRPPYSLAETSLEAIRYAAKVYTGNLQPAELQCLAEQMANVELLEAGKPAKMENEFDSVSVGQDGELVIANARFNTRVRASKQVRAGLSCCSSHSRSLICGVRVLDFCHSRNCARPQHCGARSAG